MKPFPSCLPPHTVLDCILDEHWKFNGIVHVLDVLTWKGQDIGDCETPFRRVLFSGPICGYPNCIYLTRFWWRDTRLSELPIFPPAYDTNVQTDETPLRFHFAYPVTFTPVPYHTNTTLSKFVHELIPSTRTLRRIPIQIPETDTAAMELDTPTQELQTIEAEIRSDGILLYLAQASYEPGTSPLSLWVPIQPYVEWKDKAHDQMDTTPIESPLVLFERYRLLVSLCCIQSKFRITFRLLRKRLPGSPEGQVEVEMG